MSILEYTRAAMISQTLSLKEVKPQKYYVYEEIKPKTGEEKVKSKSTKIETNTHNTSPELKH